MVEIDAVILWTASVDETLKLYRSIGVPLELEVHDDDGDEEEENEGRRADHYAADVDGVHVAVLPAPDPSLRATQRSRMRAKHERGPWGVRALVEDPDGRPVQLTTRA